MRATEFEYRHQTLIHLFIVTISFLTYLIDRDDIVWALVRGTSHPRLLERLLFALAAILIGGSAAIRTWARAYTGSSSFIDNLPVRREGPYRRLRYPEQLGNLFFSVGLGFFTPFSGFVLLLTGEAIAFFRLIRREKELRSAETHQPAHPIPAQLLVSPGVPPPGRGAMWTKAFRQESGKWGLFLTMIVFTILLRDRVAEILAGLSFLAWVLLNLGSYQM
jgi:protein-S-isoprenylcysteine O-methyltransferase Ste14